MPHFMGLSLDNFKKATLSRLWSSLAMFWLRAFQVSGLADQSQQQPFSSFHWGDQKLCESNPNQT